MYWRFCKSFHHCIARTFSASAADSLTLCTHVGSGDTLGFYRAFQLLEWRFSPHTHTSILSFFAAGMHVAAVACYISAEKTLPAPVGSMVEYQEQKPQGYIGGGFVAVRTNCLQGFEGTNQAVNGGRSCGLSSALATSQRRLRLFCGCVIPCWPSLCVIPRVAVVCHLCRRDPACDQCR